MVDEYWNKLNSITCKMLIFCARKYFAVKMRYALCAVYMATFIYDTANNIAQCLDSFACI